MFVVCVYASFSLQKLCGGERLWEMAGRDVTKEFEATEHSDTAKESCLVGDYEEVNLSLFLDLPLSLYLSL